MTRTLLNPDYLGNIIKPRFADRNLTVTPILRNSCNTQYQRITMTLKPEFNGYMEITIPRLLSGRITLWYYIDGERIHGASYTTETSDLEIAFAIIGKLRMLFDHGLP